MYIISLLYPDACLLMRYTNVFFEISNLTFLCMEMGQLRQKVVKTVK